MEIKTEIVSASVSDRGLSEKRPQNEDSYAELPQFGVFAVADGVGGAQAGDFASQMAMELLTEAVSNRSESTDAEELFHLAIEHANRSIYQMAADVPQLSTMATTIVALHLKGNIATLAHVGDSRIYRFTPDGQAFRETNDHSVVEEEVRAGRMTPEEASVHPSRNVISRALGAESSVDIDFKTIMVEPGTTFMLCSDGITRHIPDDELQSIFASGAQPELICDHLKEVCYSRGAEDNLTAVVVRTFAEPAGTVDDFDSTVRVMEEDTIATARTAFAATAGSAEEVHIEDTLAVIDLSELETGEHMVPMEDVEVLELDEPPQIVEPIPQAEPLYVAAVEADTDEQYLLTEDIERAAPEDAANKDDLSTYTSSSVVVPAQAPSREAEFTMFGQTPTAVADDHPPTGGGPGRILISIGLLILGAGIAIGASYLFGLTGQSEQAAPPQVETMKTQNIPLTSFEESRRTVDKDPGAYSARTATPTDAADFYLLGRALLLSGKTVEAKRQFELARERLPEVDESERKTLANEIALALAIAENPVAAEAFQKSIVGAQPTSNANSPIR